MNDPLIYFGDCNDDDYEKILNYENLIFIIWMSVEPGNKKLKKTLNNWWFDDDYTDRFSKNEFFQKIGKV